MTSSRHVPILADKVLELLSPQPGQIIVDCTVGGGGHAKRSPSGSARQAS